MLEDNQDTKLKDIARMEFKEAAHWCDALEVQGR